MARESRIPRKKHPRPALNQNLLRREATEGLEPERARPIWRDDDGLHGGPGGEEGGQLREEIP